MGFDWVVRLLGPGPTIDNFSAIRSGRLRIRGKVKSEGDVLRSPIKNVPCVAFFYRAWYMTRGRTGPVQRGIKEIEVYAPVFHLEMEGGSVRVVPKKPGTFDADEHVALQSHGFPGFRATEQPIKLGDRISVQGRIRKDDQGWTLQPTEIRFIASSEPPPKSRSKGKKRKKRR